MSSHRQRVVKPATSITAGQDLDIRIKVLGPQMILRSGVEIPPPAPQQRRVLSVLASRPGEVLSREWIAQQLWGAAKSAQLRGLQSYVSHLRTILGARTIELVGGGYRLNLDPACVDEVQFRRLTDQGIAAAAAGRFREARACLEQALELYRGEPYDDLGPGEFDMRRTGLKQMKEAAEDALLRIRVELVRGPQDCDSLVPLLAEAYVQGPDRDLRALLYVRTLAMAGRLSDAGEVFKFYRTRLRSLTGAEPSEEFVDTMNRLARRDRTAMSLAWGSMVVIPPYNSAIFGRAVEVHAAVSMLDVGGSSLVSVVGPRGVGKTRVAAEIALQLSDDLPGGVLWVDAASAQSGEELLERIAESIGLTGGATSIKQALPKALGSRRTLVVLDEVTALEVKAAIAILLWAGPKVSVVVTSEKPIGLASEQTLTLAPFSTSGSTATPSRAAEFVESIMRRLGVAPPQGAGSLQSKVAESSGLPSDLEQLALNLLSGPAAWPGSESALI